MDYSERIHNTSGIGAVASGWVRSRHSRLEFILNIPNSIWSFSGSSQVVSTRPQKLNQHQRILPAGSGPRTITAVIPPRTPTPPPTPVSVLLSAQPALPIHHLHWSALMTDGRYGWGRQIAFSAAWLHRHVQAAQTACVFFRRTGVSDSFFFFPFFFRFW